MAKRWRGRRPQPERPVDVHPRVRPQLPHRRDGRRERVEGAAVHVAGLEADDRRAARAAQDRAQRIEADAALLVGRHAERRLLAEAEQAKAREHGDVRVLTDHHRNAGAAVHAVRLHVPADPAQDRVARGSERREVGHGRSRRETNRRAGR